MLYSSRLLHTIVDRLLQLLPPEPAVFKRLDDIGEAEPSDAPETKLMETKLMEASQPESGVRSATTVRAAS